jgi:hypothetical protein
MPVVPRYESQQTNQVAQAQQVSATPLNVAPVAKVANEIADVFQKARDDADRMRVLSAKTQLQKDVNDLTYGEGGYAHAQGINALHAGDQARKGFERSQANILKDMNPRQREMFQAELGSTANSFNANLQNHVYNENRKAVLTTIDDSIFTHAETMKQNYNNPTEIARNILGIESGVTDLESQSGIVSPEFRLKRQSAALTETALTALSQQIPDFQSAKNIVDSFGDRMTVDDKNKLKETMRPLQLAAESSLEAQSIFDQYKQDPQGRAKALLSISDPQKKQQVSINLSLLDKAYDEDQGLKSSNVMNRFLETGKIDALGYAQLDTDSQNKVRVAIDSKRKADVNEAYTNEQRAESKQARAVKREAMLTVNDVLTKVYSDPNYLKTINVPSLQLVFDLAGQNDLYASLKKDSMRVNGQFDIGDAKRYAYQRVTTLIKPFAPVDQTKAQKYNASAFTTVNTIISELEGEYGEKPIPKSAIDKRISEGFARGDISTSTWMGLGSDEKQGFRYEAGDKPFTPNAKKAVKPAKTIQEVPLSFSEPYRRRLSDMKLLPNDKKANDAILEDYNNSILMGE